MPSTKHILCAQVNNQFKEIVEWAFALADPDTRVVHVSDSESALEKIRKNKRYIGVITGYYLPPMGGPNLARNMRIMGYEGPIVGFSVLSDYYYEEDARQCGMSHYVGKPDITDLVQVFKDLSLVPRNPFAGA